MYKTLAKQPFNVSLKMELNKYGTLLNKWNLIITVIKIYNITVIVNVRGTELINY